MRLHRIDILAGAGLCAFLATIPPAAAAQDGQIDRSFNTADDGFHGSGPFGHVYATCELPDGSVAVGGLFDSYHMTFTKRLVRILLPDGGRDPSFDIGTGPDGWVNTFHIQPGGKLVVGGAFSNFNGQPYGRLLRLHLDGSIDTAFGVGGAPSGAVHVLTAQPDGKLLIGGRFNSVGGVLRGGIARLDSDGQLDLSFDPGTGVSGGTIITQINAIGVQSDGRVLIGGDFQFVNGIPRANIARLNANGSLDATFPVEANSHVQAIHVLSDDKVWVGGSFQQVGGAANRGLVRLLASGAIDSTLPSAWQPDGSIHAIDVLPDESLLVGGWFTTVGGAPRQHVARLHPDGSADLGFNPGVGPESVSVPAVYSVTAHSSGRILVGGTFSTFNGHSSGYLASLHPDGSVDTLFNQPVGASGSVNVVERRDDGKYLIGGSFRLYNNVARSGIARLHGDGSLDTTFDPGSGAGPTPYSIDALATQPDGATWVGGRFNTFDGLARGGITRLLSNGATDPTFHSGTGIAGTSAPRIRAIALLGDGRALVAGRFTSYDGIPRNHLVRVLPDGAIDLSFDPGLGASDGLRDIHVLPDDRLLVVGAFTTYSGVVRPRVARLLPDGTVDPSFDPGAGANSEVEDVVVQPDGKILLGGWFTAFNGVSRRGIARLEPSGALDLTLNPGQGVSTSGFVSTIALQSDGRILLAGRFGTFAGVPHRGITRLAPDGQVDSTFEPTPGTTGEVYRLQLQPDGRAVVAGSFSDFNGTSRRSIVRIEAFLPHSGFCFGDGSGTPCPCGNSGAVDAGCANSVSPVGGRLTAEGGASLSSETLVLVGTDMPSSTALYFQGTTEQNGGLGTVFGDGLRCAGGAVIRLGTRVNASGASRYPESGDPAISVRGQVNAPGMRTYQIWYRNAAAFCTASTFNLSNGMRIDWHW